MCRTVLFIHRGHPVRECFARTRLFCSRQIYNVNVQYRYNVYICIFFTRYVVGQVTSISWHTCTRCIQSHIVGKDTQAQKLLTRVGKCERAMQGKGKARHRYIGVRDKFSLHASRHRGPLAREKKEKKEIQIDGERGREKKNVT